MGVRKFKPVTPGTRFRVGSDFAEITTSTPEKSLLLTLSKKGGRNSNGRITTKHRGGGSKRKYRIIDFKRDKQGMAGEVLSIEYDPNRTARIALLQYEDGEKRYIIAPNGLAVGAKLFSGEGASPELGNAMYLSDIPLGSIIHNIEMQPGKGAQIARSAGSYAQLTAREGKYATLKLPSGETRMILKTCLAVIGSVSNADHNLTRLGKAGRKRWLGIRPHTRGVVMNPVDHPMGGGEGRQSGGHPRSRTGVYAKGLKTRDKKKSSNRLIISKRKK
ncbi:MAG: 50S ribosomal protein L2 [Chitinophagales bacterium]|nr:50S ribosomal protein L2 [Bacteroidota bacterium]MCB9255926.1 50S ribosomal protein L2 [Chitinophagales bacterium]